MIEGSALGGIFIAREVQRRLAIDAASGASFFWGDGEATGSIWKKFAATLNEEISQPLLALEAAKSMFSVFEHYLNLPSEVTDAR